MKKYNNKEFAHLKWRLISQDGLTPKEADDRIKEIQLWDIKIKKDKKRK